MKNYDLKDMELNPQMIRQLSKSVTQKTVNNFKRLKKNIINERVDFQDLTMKLRDKFKVRDTVFNFTQEDMNPRGGFKLNQQNLITQYKQMQEQIRERKNQIMKKRFEIIEWRREIEQKNNQIADIKKEIQGLYNQVGSIQKS